MDTSSFLLLMENRRRRLAYVDKLLAIQSASFIAGWPFGEASGSVADNAEGTAARDGEYVGVTLGEAGIGDGGSSPLFDGANDYVDVYSPSLAGVYDQSELSAMIWFQVSGIGVWSDSTYRKVFRYYVSNDNTLKLERDAADNRLAIKVEHGTTSKYLSWDIGPSLDWLCFMVTISESNDRIRIYGQGSLLEAETTGLGTWAGPLASAYSLIGANSKTPSQVWDGKIAFPWIWTTELTDAEVLEAYTI